MKTNLFLELKQVVTYYLELKNKKEMGFSITLKDIESLPIKTKIKKRMRMR